MWHFIQNQIFGMQWLHVLITGLLNIFGLNTETPIGGSVLFFIYDVLKISLLLCVLIFIITYVQSYFPPERSRKILGRFHGFWANTIAALLGTVTPFCSCSSIPLFMGFTQAGLPLGVTFSFLISSPMVDMASLILLMSIFGWKVAVLYVVLGLVVAVAGGSLIEKLHMEDQVADFIRAAEEKKKMKAAFVPVAKKMSTGIAASVAPQPWEAKIPLELLLQPFWVSPCTLIFSVPCPLQKAFWQREPCWAL